MIWLLTGLAGGLGAAMRVVSSERIDARFGRPCGTLSVNVLGTAGLVAVFLSPIGADTRLILGVGLLGGLTTFSTWMVDTIWLAMDQNLATATLHLARVAVVGIAIAAVSLFG